MELGDTIPRITLPAEAGHTITPSEVIGFHCMLVLFYAPECEISKAYSNRLAKLFDNYHDENLRTFFVNIHPNDHNEVDVVKAALKDAGASQRNFLDDADHEALQAFDTKRTPKAYIFDRNRELIYKGAIDDNWQHPEGVTRVYLEDALENALDALEVDFPEVEPVGTPVNEILSKTGNK